MDDFKEALARSFLEHASKSRCESPAECRAEAARLLGKPLAKIDLERLFTEEKSR